MPLGPAPTRETDPNYDLWLEGQRTGQLPSRQMSDADLNRFNQVMRASPVYQNFMVAHGLPVTGNVQLTRQQQSDLEQALARSGFPLSGGMHIDQGGNVNQQNRTVKNAAYAAAMAGGGVLAGSQLAPLLAGGAGAGGAGGGAALTAPMVSAPAAAAPAAAGGGLLASTPLAGTLAPLAAPVAASGTGGGLLASTALGGTLAPYAAPVSASGTGAGAAATGSTLSRVLKGADTAGRIGQVTGGAAERLALERERQNLANTQRGNTLANIYGTQQNAALRAREAGSDERLRQATQDLAQRRFALDAPTVRGAQSVRGSLMANLQPASITLPAGFQHLVPTLHGGLNPEALSPETRQLGAQMARDALTNQLKGDTFAPQTPTDFQGALIPPPTQQLDELQKSSALEKVLGNVGLLSSIWGAVR